MALLSLAVSLLSPGLGGTIWGAGIPNISGLSPTSHAAGAFPVILTGSNFTGVNVVNIYNYDTGFIYYANAPFSVDSASQITVNSGLSVNFPGANYYFEAISPGGISNPSPTLTVTGAGGAPVIDAISPTGHAAGAFAVVLSGQNFTDVYNVTVYHADSGYIFYANATFTVDSDTQITVSADLSIYYPAGTYYFEVINLSGISNHSPTLTVSAAAPVITGINPTRHASGTFEVIITGAHFTGLTDLNYAGPIISDASVSLDSDTQITLTGTFPAGAYSFQAVTPDGTSNSSPTLTVFQAAVNPAIDLMLLD